MDSMTFGGSKRMIYWGKFLKTFSRLLKYSHKRLYRASLQLRDKSDTIISKNLESTLEIKKIIFQDSCTKRILFICDTVEYYTYEHSDSHEFTDAFKEYSSCKNKDNMIEVKITEHDILFTRYNKWYLTPQSKIKNN